MSRRKYQRRIGKRRYKRMFVLSTEGTVTEPGYFKMFNNDTTVLHVKVIKNKGSGPITVLREMKRFFREASLRDDDEAWLVIDKDNWTESQLTTMFNWSISDSRYGLAVSNPRFEYWLLLHFEEGNKISSPNNCSDRLKRYLPNYDKVIQPDKMIPGISEAIRRAEIKDTPPCIDWPRNTGTTVYRLIKSLRKTENR